MTAILAALAFVIVSGLFIEAFAWLFRRKDRETDALSRWADDGGSVAQKPIQKLPEGK